MGRSKNVERVRGAFPSLLRALVFVIVLCGCESKGLDGSTHFVKCESDADCPSDQSCIEKSCVPSADVASSSQPLEWSPCTDDSLKDAECASLAVPVDYSNPDGEKI